MDKGSVPELIVMLTYNDHTVENAYEIFDQCKGSRAMYWGMKEEGLDIEEMKKLFSYMKKCGKKTALEVVRYTEEECLQGARIAAECGCDLLMGTVFFDSVNEFSKENNLKYMPFVGNVTGRPSVLEGEAEEMIRQAKMYADKGVYGIDLLAYRYNGNANELIEKFVSEVKMPVCIAGSINSFDKIDTVKLVGASAMTIGSAFFDNCFGNGFMQQIEAVYQQLGGR